MKRANGEGSGYFDKARNTNVFEIDYINPVTGEKIRVKRSSKQSVAQAKRLVMKQIELLKQEAKVKSKESAITVKDWFDRWLNDTKKSRLKVKTYERYESHIKLNIIPYIGDIPLEDIDLSKLDWLLNQLLEQGGQEQRGIAPRSVNAVRNILRAAFAAAKSRKIILENPAIDLEPVREEKASFPVLTHDQAKKLIREALTSSKHTWIIIVMALASGMRIGELFGLQWRDIDLNKKQLCINHTVVTTKNGVLIQRSGKNNYAKRVIPLPDYAIHAIRRYRQWVDAASKRYGYKYATSEWFLSNPEGTPRSPNSFTTHEFKPLVKSVGIPEEFRVHDLRHTHATWLLENDVNIKVVSERLGHASVRITLETYSHVLKTMQDKAVDTLNKIF